MSLELCNVYTFRLVSQISKTCLSNVVMQSNDNSDVTCASDDVSNEDGDDVDFRQQQQQQQQHNRKWRQTFSPEELRDLFTFNEDTSCQTHDLLSKQHSRPFYSAIFTV